MQISYDIAIGRRSLSSRDATGSALVAVEVERGVEGAGGRCTLHLSAGAGPWPTAGDRLRVEIDAGRGRHPVFTGEVRTIEGGIESSSIQGRDGLARLAELELERSYEEVSAGFIIKDLIDAAGAEAGQLDEGPSFPRYVLHEGPRALHHAKRLGALVGADLHTDGEGRIHFRRPKAAPARHRLRCGEGVLHLELARHDRVLGSLEVWGEGAAGTDGAAREHWLPTDLTGVRGQATLEGEPDAPRVAVGRVGERPRVLVDGAIRSVDAAEDVAAAIMQAQALRSHVGTVLVPGLVDVEPGDFVELAELPPTVRPSTGDALGVRVRRLWHLLSPTQGLLTRLEF